MATLHEYTKRTQGWAHQEGRAHEVIFQLPPIFIERHTIYLLVGIWVIGNEKCYIALENKIWGRKELRGNENKFPESAGDIN